MGGLEGWAKEPLGASRGLIKRADKGKFWVIGTHAEKEARKNCMTLSHLNVTIRFTVID